MSIQEAFTVLSTAQSVFGGAKEAKRAKQTANAQVEAANKTAAAAEEEKNKRNARKPDIAAITDRNKVGIAEGGQTMLTGAMGVPNSSLRLMQKSLLGQ